MTQSTQEPSIKDLRIAQQIVERAYERGQISRLAYLKSELDTERQISIKAMAVQSVKRGGFIRIKS